MDDQKDFQYSTDLPTGKRTVDRAPRAPNPDNDRALEALRKIVNPLDVRIAENAMPMEAPHVGDSMSQRKTAQLILAGRSYQAVQAWLNGEPMPNSMVEWLVNDLQRVDASPRDRMVRIGEDEIAIVVKR